MLEIFVDGSCRSNPGPMEICAFIPDIGYIKEPASYHNRGTNNIAEYIALHRGLDVTEGLHKLELEEIVIKTDSALVANQVNGNWKIKEPHLRIYARVAMQRLKTMSNVKLQWIPREQNRAGRLLE